MVSGELPAVGIQEGKCYTEFKRTKTAFSNKELRKGAVRRREHKPDCNALFCEPDVKGETASVGHIKVWLSPDTPPQEVE